MLPLHAPRPSARARPPPPSSSARRGRAKGRIERERGLDEEAEMPRGALPLYTLITRWEAMRETLPSRWAPRLT